MYLYHVPCHPHVYPQVEWTIPAFTPQSQSIIALWLVLISRPSKDMKLSLPAWHGEIPRWFARPTMVTPIPVLTEPTQSNFIEAPNYVIATPRHHCLLRVNNLPKVVKWKQNNQERNPRWVLSRVQRPNHCAITPPSHTTLMHAVQHIPQGLDSLPCCGWGSSGCQIPRSHPQGQRRTPCVPAGTTHSSPEACDWTDSDKCCVLETQQGPDDYRQYLNSS